MPIVLLLLVAVCFNLKAQNMGQYQVQLDTENALITVHACLNQPTRYLATGRADSHHYLRFFSQQHQPLALSSKIQLTNSTDHCFQYQVDINKALKSKQSFYQEKSWLLNNQLWLWLPIEDMTLTVKFSQPVSAPWPLSAEGSYQINTENAFWPSRLAFGQLQQYQLKIAEQKLRLDLVGNFSPIKKRQLKQWLQQAAGAIANIYQSFPVTQIQLLVTKARRGSGPVPWGEVQRGGYPAVHLFINPNYSLDSFKQDWTASHELSHLLLPKIRGRDRWLSEGIASYYQNVARAKAGQLSPHQSWQKLRSGFKRGQKAAASTPLRQAHKTMHIYWGGAAIFMLADMRLRQLPSALTLDLVLKRLQHCCLPNNRIWSAEQLMTKLDQLSQSQIFSQLLQHEAQAKVFPIPNSIINGPLPASLLSPPHKPMWP